MEHYRLTMRPREYRGHRLFCRPGEQGWVVYFELPSGVHFDAYSLEPLTALGVLEAIDWATRAPVAAIGYTVEEACAC